jgi:hypothetical protein
MDISALKSRRYDINKLVEAAQEANGSTKSNNNRDENLWKPTVDKAGNGYAVIRFLPNESSDGTPSEVPWVRYWDHGFKGPTGKWYIEKSLTSIGQTDPLGELNSRLWSTGNETDRETVRKQKRRLHYVVNILVISDPSAPENEGKVFKYQFGKKIFDKIEDLMQPKFPGEVPVDPFDVWSGADFQLKIRQVEGYRNYDRSEFKEPSQLHDGDEVRVQAALNQLHDINDYVDPANYKSYDELKSKLNDVLGETAPRTIKEEVALDNSEPPWDPAPVTAEAAGNEGDDDAMSFFQKLANAD